MAALVLDQGLLRKADMDLHNALDAGTLAGAALAEDDPAGAENGSARMSDVPAACASGCPSG